VALAAQVVQVKALASRARALEAQAVVDVGVGADLVEAVAAPPRDLAQVKGNGVADLAARVAALASRVKAARVVPAPAVSAVAADLAASGAALVNRVKVARVVPAEAVALAAAGADLAAPDLAILAAPVRDLAKVRGNRANRVNRARALGVRVASSALVLEELGADLAAPGEVADSREAAILAQEQTPVGLAAAVLGSLARMVREGKAIQVEGANDPVDPVGSTQAAPRVVHLPHRAGLPVILLDRVIDFQAVFSR
jgi:hypothetical protein